MSASPPIPPSRTAWAVEALLRDLGPRLRRGADPEGAAAPPRLPTGIDDVDRLLHGGFPRGELCEIAGPLSCGRTSLALALLARTTAAGEVAAVVDGADAFDPGSAEAADVALERVLWVRAPRAREALRCAERLLVARGFALVVLDLALARPTLAPAAWARLARAAAVSRTALVVLSLERQAGTSAGIALELAPARARFTGAPTLLEELEIEVALARHRSAPAHRVASVRLRSTQAA